MALVALVARMALTPDGWFLMVVALSNNVATGAGLVTFSACFYLKTLPVKR
jgi:hypothetical protein